MSMAVTSLVGRRFRWLKVVALSQRESRHVYWRCVCRCGAEVEARSDNLKCGDTTSCGCRNRSRLRTHGKSRTPEFACWSAMIARCYNKNNKDYDRYGGRGITVCARWRKSFVAFLNDMGQRPIGKTLDRSDNDKGYSPKNCRWATIAQQNRNKSNVRLSAREAAAIRRSKKSTTVIAEKYGVAEATIRLVRSGRSWAA